jgi:hypothetical protein
VWVFNSSRVLHFFYRVLKCAGNERVCYSALYQNDRLSGGSRCAEKKWLSAARSLLAQFMLSASYLVQKSFNVDF